MVLGQLLPLFFALFLAGCEFLDSDSKPPKIPSAIFQRYALVPFPRAVEPVDGDFELAPTTRIAADTSNPEVARLANTLASRLRTATGYDLTVGAPGVTPEIRLALDAAVAEDEGYELDVDSERIDVRAKTTAGMFYGVATVTQLFPWQIASTSAVADVVWKVPRAHLKDAPRFSYRGAHLDVSRHFFSPDFVKTYIDLLASYKLNTFHWHLTDDQGWRIEIKKYPLLTEVGAFRRETVVGRPGPMAVYDGQRYGGFYTQDEIRDIVAYAQARYVTIIPEIEMPGHCLAALASYPEFACTPGPFQTATTWGIFEDIYCPSEGTFQFLEDVLTEVIDLFPENLGGVANLESYFIGRIASFLRSKGRKAVGWDEIADGSTTIPDAVVMSWRGVDKATAALGRGYPVIMTPTTFCYFDQYQTQDQAEPLAIGGYLPLQKVYEFEPLPAYASTASAALVLGGQANLWTEYIATPEHAEHMLFPRLQALAEVMWSPSEVRDYDGLVTRLSTDVLRLETRGVNYARYFLDAR